MIVHDALTVRLAVIARAVVGVFAEDTHAVGGTQGTITARVDERDLLAVAPADEEETRADVQSRPLFTHDVFARMKRVSLK